jgi:hypothetical protein
MNALLLFFTILDVTVTKSIVLARLIPVLLRRKDSQSPRVRVEQVSSARVPDIHIVQTRLISLPEYFF